MTLQGFRSVRSYLPLICYVVLQHNLSNEDIISFFTKIKQANYPGRGEDQHVSTVSSRYKTLTSLLKN